MTGIFQNQALEELDTPEQLNQQIRVIKPHMWMIFCILAVMCVSCGYWFVFGSLSSTVNVEGIVFPTLGAETISAKAEGTVQDVLFSPGDQVSAGDILVVVADREVLQEIEGCRTQLLEEKTPQKKKICQEKLSEQYDQYEQYSMVRAPADGTLQRIVSLDSGVQAGEEVASVLVENQASNSREIIGYLPLVNASQLKVGMEAQVCPAYVQREEYGYMKGYVSYVGAAPVTEELLRQHYGTAEYVKDILPDSSCVEIRISMYMDEESQNHFSWSNEKGENLEVGIGTICSIQIVREKKRPAQLLFD